MLLTVTEDDLKTSYSDKLPGKYVITNASTEKAEKVGAGQKFTVKFIPDDQGFEPIVLGKSAEAEVKPALFAEDVNFVVNNVSVPYDGKAHYLGEGKGEGVTILADKLAFAAEMCIRDRPRPGAARRQNRRG